ncbi:MAG TPA: ABC transporter permease [Candidatus Excrementavichristensenella intestinipullorum]|nr:ABC transporter permease [Candidatus Excrementavichristensenella intestinipullorum]
MSDIFNIGLLQNTLRTTTPVVLAALGIMMTDHVGIMNIGMDGMMLCGAFFAVLGSCFLGSWGMGLLTALAVGLVLGLFFGVLVIKFKSDEFIIGVALNIFAGGLTVFLLRTIFGVAGAFSGSQELPIYGLPRLNWPWLDSIPLIGPLLGGNTLLVYASWALVALCYLFIYKTPMGFWMRAAGEHPESLRAAGISPEKMKYLASLLCGLFSGLAGAHLSLGYLTMFTENMSASRGFIAVACCIFGRSNPPKIFLAALLFGFIDALGLRLQSVGISSNLTSMAPYVVTVVMMVWVVRRAEHKKQKLALLRG